MTTGGWMQPGWYPDPVRPDIQRWWDGAQWTPATQPAYLMPPQPDYPPFMPPAYGQPVHAPYGPDRQNGVGLLGIALAAAGIVLVILAFTTVTWLDLGLGRPGDTATFHQLAGDPTVPGFQAAYFSWLGWLLLAVGGIAAIFAAVPVENRATVHAVAAAAAVAALLTDGAALVDLVHKVHDADLLSVGPWLALAGFALLSIAAAAGRVGTHR